MAWQARSGNVCFWHVTDIGNSANNVGLMTQSGLFAYAELTLPLFNGKRLSQEEATHAILQIYSALGEQFQHADFDIADSPVRPPVS